LARREIAPTAPNDQPAIRPHSSKQAMQASAQR